MKDKAIFFHAGCPVCVSAESTLLGVLDRDRVDVEVVHLGDARNRIPEARRLGVQSVPALAMKGQVLHINYGASLADIEK